MKKVIFFWMGCLLSLSVFGQSLNFETTHAYVETNQTNISKQFTAEAWVNLSTLTPPSTFGMAVAKWNGSPSGEGQNFVLGYATTHYENRFYSKISNGTTHGVTSVYSDFPIKIDQWYHLASTYDGETFKLYIDGNLTDEVKVQNGIKITPEPIIIGNNSTHNFAWKGKLDEIRIWNKALSADEIANNWNKSFTNASNLSDCLELYYPVKSQSGNISDESGNGHTGVLHNNASYSNQSPSEVNNANDTKCEEGSSISLNGGLTKFKDIDPNKAYYLKNEKEGNYWYLNPSNPHLELRELDLNDNKFKWYITKYGSSAVVQNVATGKYLKESLEFNIPQHTLGQYEIVGEAIVFKIYSNLYSATKTITAAPDKPYLANYSNYISQLNNQDAYRWLVYEAAEHQSSSTNNNNNNTNNTFGGQTISDINAVPPNGHCQIIPKLTSNRAVEVSNGSTANSANIVLNNNYSDNESQQFEIIQLANKYYKIINVKSGKALCVFGAQTSEGTHTHQYDYSIDNVGNQDWKLIKTASGFYAFSNRQTGYVLTLENGSTGTGTKLVQKKWQGEDSQLFEIKKILPSFINIQPNLSDQDQKITAALTQNNGSFDLSQSINIASQFSNELSKLDQYCGFGFANAIGLIENATVTYYEGNPSGLRLDGDSKPQYPTTEIKGTTTFFEQKVEIDLWFSYGLKAYVTAFIKFPELAGQMKKATEFGFMENLSGLTNMLGGVYLEDTRVVFTTYTHVNDVDYGFSWNEGINFLGKLYFGDRTDKVRTTNSFLKTIADAIHCDEFKVHLALDLSNSATPSVLAEMEAMVEVPIFPLPLPNNNDYYFRTDNVGTVEAPIFHNTLVWEDHVFDNEKFAVKLISMGGSVQLDESSIELKSSAQAQIAFKEPFADRKDPQTGENALTVLQLKENPGVKFGESIDYSFAGTLEKITYSKDGVFQSNNNGLVWKDPMGIPNSEIKNAAVQFAVSPNAPYLKAIGMAGTGSFLGKSGEFGFLVDLSADNPFEKMISLVAVNEIDMIDVGSFMFGGGFSGLAVANAGKAKMPKEMKNFIDKVLFAKMTDVGVSFVGTPGKIGEIQFNNKGITATGKLKLWDDWTSFVHFHADDQNGISFKSYIDPFTWDINGTTVFGLEGNQGNQDHMEDYTYNSTTYAWTANNVFVGDKPHLNVHIPFNLQNDSNADLEIGIHCDILLFNKRIPIDFDMNQDSELAGSFEKHFGASYIKGDVVLSSKKFYMGGEFHLDVPQINIPSFEVGNLGFPEIKVAKFTMTMLNSSILIEPDKHRVQIKYGGGGAMVNLLGTGNQNINIPSFTIDASINSMEELPNLVADYIKDNAADLFSNLGSTIESTLFNAADIAKYKIIFFEGDGCTESAYAWDELANDYTVINLKNTRPASSISNNQSSTFFETNLTTKNDEIRSFMILPGNDWFKLHLYDHPDGHTDEKHVKLEYMDLYFKQVCFTLDKTKGGEWSEFPNSKNDPSVRLWGQRNYDGQLAGKVSRIYYGDIDRDFEKIYKEEFLVVILNDEHNTKRNYHDWKAHIDQVADASCGVGLNLFYSLFSWGEFPVKIRNAWSVLGWNALNWDGDTNYPASYNKSYNQLNSEEKKAANTLGYYGSCWEQK